jgi:putative N6-adenine-specific DNA methylase
VQKSLNFNYTATCHFGLEKILLFELKRAGAENAAAQDGRVNFSGDLRVLAKASISCSVAERIGIVIADFDANSFDEVFDGLRSLKLSDYIPKDGKFPVVKGQSVKSKLTSIPALQRTVKKALAVAMQKCCGASPAETGETYPVRFFLHKNRLSVYIDTSGEGLHKRGYRQVGNAAPIRETLAAGLASLSKVKPTDTVIDPFCGSGTILIESAYKALNIPPCLNRNFVAETWKTIPRNVWSEAREELQTKIITNSDFHAAGFDNDKSCVSLTIHNAKKAGVSNAVSASLRDISNFSYPDKPCKIITNPPYGERMSNVEETKNLYRKMGEKMLPKGENQVYVIAADEEFETLFGEKASGNRKLYNGMLKCRYFMFDK